MSTDNVSTQSVPLQGTSLIPKPGLVDLCLKITGSFEGGDPKTHGMDNMTGNSDDEGLSLGVLQQCLGQGSLQPLLNEMLKNHRGILVNLWGDDVVKEFEHIMASSRSEQVRWGDSISGHPNKDHVVEPWHTRLKKMLLTSEYIALQDGAASGVFQKAVNYCIEYKLHSIKALALMFDIVTQNGSINQEQKNKINELKSEKEANLGRVLTEPEYLECIAMGRASFSRPKYQADVASRKLCIARGKSLPFTWNGKKYDGRVHEDYFDLEKDLGLDNSPWAV